VVSRHRPHRGARRTALACAVVVLAGCTASEAAVPAAADPYEPHPASAIVDRLAADDEGRLPALDGLPAEEAAARLAALGLQAQVVAYDAGPVSAQYPEPGARAPADGVVIVWTGSPPAPPPPPSPEPTAAPAERDETAAAAALERDEPSAPEPTPAADDAPKSTPTPTPTPTAAPPSGGGGSHPPRTSPRRMDPVADGTVLEGRASWYGPGFAGRTTACGNTFDPAAFTLATRELPCGTRVLVTGPSGRTVEAVANDWGPAEWTGRRFDLSRATFEAIHPLSAGVASVTVEVLP
jgi:rare lipoprotein A